MEQKSVIDMRKLRAEIAPYQQPSRLRSIWQLLNTLIPYLALWYVAFRMLDYSFWLTLPILALLAGFMIRIFIIFHDCGHGSFFQSSRANRFWGVITGILTFTPYQRWRMSHARHHGTSANLDKRGHGDVWMMTLKEYLEAPRILRIKYRLYRNPLVMFLLGPLLMTLLSNRIGDKKATKSERHSAYITNVGIAMFSAGMVLLFGWKAFLLIQLLALWMAQVVGVWLFYVQHQFEGVYWERESGWDLVTAALEGGSFYDLPAILRWFSGSIGYHHLHHLNPRIPNYNLARCQKSNPTLQETKSIGLFASLKSLKFRLWDEDSGKLIGFRNFRSRQSILEHSAAAD